MKQQPSALQKNLMRCIKDLKLSEENILLRKVSAKLEEVHIPAKDYQGVIDIFYLLAADIPHLIKYPQDKSKIKNLFLSCAEHLKRLENQQKRKLKAR